MAVGRVDPWIGSGRVGLDRVEFFEILVGRVGSGQESGGSGWVGSRYLDPWPSVIFYPPLIGLKKSPPTL